MAAHVYRFWTSDNIDALARVPMQRGFLAFMPPEMMGAHIGTSPSHATGRTQSLDFRAAIACQGHLGVELDPATLAPEESRKLAGWIAFYKQWRRIIHGGSTWLGEAKDGLVWQAQGTAQDILLWVVRADHPHDRHAQPIPLPFAARNDWDMRLLRTAVNDGVLTPQAASGFTTMRETPKRFAGRWLAHAGLPVPTLPAESALIFHMKAIPA